MARSKIFEMSFGSVYPLYLNKVERKGRSENELLQVIEWLTGYSPKDINEINSQNVSFEKFFSNAPSMNLNRKLITGVICGVRVENIENPLMQEIRYLDKLVDELARGKKLASILRKAKS